MRRSPSGNPFVRQGMITRGKLVELGEILPICVQMVDPYICRDVVQIEVKFDFKLSSHPIHN